MLLLPLSVLILLTQPPRSLGAEMKTYSQRAVANACALVMCSPMENGLPGRDGRDGREGPRGEKGDPGTAGPTGLSWWRGVGAGIVTNPETENSAVETLEMVFFPRRWVSPRYSAHPKHGLAGWLGKDRLPRAPKCLPPSPPALIPPLGSSDSTHSKNEQTVSK